MSGSSSRIAANTKDIHSGATDIAGLAAAAGQLETAVPTAVGPLPTGFPYVGDIDHAVADLVARARVVAADLGRTAASMTAYATQLDALEAIQFELRGFANMTAPKSHKHRSIWSRAWGDTKGAASDAGNEAVHIVDKGAAAADKVLHIHDLIADLSPVLGAAMKDVKPLLDHPVAWVTKHFPGVAKRINQAVHDAKRLASSAEKVLTIGEHDASAAVRDAATGVEQLARDDSQAVRDIAEGAGRVARGIRVIPIIGDVVTVGTTAYDNYQLDVAVDSGASPRTIFHDRLQLATDYANLVPFVGDADFIVSEMPSKGRLDLAATTATAATLTADPGALAMTMYIVMIDAREENLYPSEVLQKLLAQHPSLKATAPELMVMAQPQASLDYIKSHATEIAEAAKRYVPGV